MWYLPRVERLLPKSFLPYELESFLVFWLQKSFQVFVFPFCAFWHSWVAILFGSKSEVYETKIKPRELTTMLPLGPKIHSQLPSLISVFLTFVLYMLSSFLVVFSESNQENVSFILTEAEVSIRLQIFRNSEQKKEYDLYILFYKLFQKILI